MYIAIFIKKLFVVLSGMDENDKIRIRKITGNI
jgi:hypothetical protein